MRALVIAEACIVIPRRGLGREVAIVAGDSQLDRRARSRPEGFDPLRSGAAGTRRDRVVRSVLAERLVDQCEELADVQRLGQVGDGAGGQETLDLTLGCVGADDDDGDRGRLRVVAQLLEDLVARDVGKVEVEQDEGRVVLAGQCCRGRRRRVPRA
jgi:hypothetical protein